MLPFERFLMSGTGIFVGLWFLTRALSAQVASLPWLRYLIIVYTPHSLCIILDEYKMIWFLEACGGFNRLTPINSCVSMLGLWSLWGGVALLEWMWSWRRKCVTLGMVFEVSYTQAPPNVESELPPGCLPSVVCGSRCKTLSSFSSTISPCILKCSLLWQECTKTFEL